MLTGEKELFLEGTIIKSCNMSYVFQVLHFTKIVMFFVFVIVRNWLLLYTNEQFRSSGSGTVTLDFFASFLAFKYSTGTFLRLNPFATISQSMT